MSALLLVPHGRSSVLAHTGALWAVPIGIWLLHEHPSKGTAVGLCWYSPVLPSTSRPTAAEAEIAH